MRVWLGVFASLGGVLGGASCGGQSVIGEGEPRITGDFGGSGGTGVASGGSGPAGWSGTGNAGLGGAGVAGAPATGSGGASYSPLCDLQLALSKSCARIGCHSAADRFADLDLSNPSAVPAILVDQPATHGDINCAMPGMPFRECMPHELPAGCPPNALLIDRANPEESWILKKLRGDESCGDAMPLPPGNSVSNGWNDARRACLEDWIYELAEYAGSRAGDP